MCVFARAVNRKFFGKGAEDEFTWARWFFPLVTDDRDLKAIDAHIQEYMRFVSSGRFNKANYRIRYDDLKKCGYISLVNRYHSILCSIKKISSTVRNNITSTGPRINPLKPKTNIPPSMAKKIIKG